jgi:site-specific DNA recombinase
MPTTHAQVGPCQRFAIYTRYSCDMQNELSLDTQEERCRQAVAERGGRVAEVFRDGAKNGWSLTRDGFMQLRRAASEGKFDAVMLWKFDRLARDPDHAIIIKMLLRHEYGLKLFCVEGFSEDEGDSAYGAIMEQMLAVFAAFYSRNLSSETRRGKRHRALNGEFNGSLPPLGYDLVTRNDATQDRPAGLYILARLAAIVRRAFRMYATGKYSDVTIAEWMNQRHEIQKLRQGQKPIGKEMVRDMLQNRVYTGRVPYAETHYSGALGQGKCSNRHRKQWFEGKHEGFISDELFEACQQARRLLAKKRRPPERTRTYILHDRVFCLRCTVQKPANLLDANYGKMRPSWDPKRQQGWYRCIARDRGYHRCEQPVVVTDLIDEQVIAALAKLTVPEAFRARVNDAVRNRIEQEETQKRLAEIEGVARRIDFSWEQGFLTGEEYMEKRNQLQQAVESLQPATSSDLMEAANLLQNFTAHWQSCSDVAEAAAAQKQLLAKIVDRVFVYNHQVVAIALHGDYKIVLDGAAAAPPDLANWLEE